MVSGMDPLKNVELGRPLHTWEKSLLERCDLYLVGGAVRDILLGASGESLDDDYLAVGIKLEDMISALSEFGKTSLVGKSFGVVKFAAPSGKTVDVSLPRAEVSIGPGHREFRVTYDADLPVDKDLVRRDFTINSMALHLGDMTIVDPRGGRGDLEKGLLRINSPESFMEDPLRILRGVQFLARFGLAADEETKRKMERDAELLETVSPERVRGELNKMMLLSARPSVGFTFMHDTGVLGLLLPELDETYGVEQNEYHPDDLFTHSVKSCDAAPAELHLRWSALMHDLGKKAARKIVGGRIVFYRHEDESARIAEAVLERLRFPRDFTRKVTHIVKHHMFNITDEWSDSAIRRFVARVGRENIDDLFALRVADACSMGNTKAEEEIGGVKERVECILSEQAALKREDLAVDGNEVMRLLGIGPGPGVGRVLNHLLEIVLEDAERNDRESLIEIIKGMQGGKK